jgi:hypothetical protein
VTRGGAAGCAAVAALAAAAIGGAGGGADRGGLGVVTVGDTPAVATGFTVAPGRVVTVAHVLDAGPGAAAGRGAVGEDATVTVRGADGVARRGTVVRRDDRLDLALLDVPGLRAAPAPPAAGTRVLVRRDGAAAALSATVTRRIDARVRQGDRVARRPAVELVAPIGVGDSGAPVLHDGRVVGVVFATSSRRDEVAYAVDAAVLDSLVR